MAQSFNQYDKHVHETPFEGYEPKHHVQQISIGYPISQESGKCVLQSYYGKAVAGVNDSVQLHAIDLTSHQKTKKPLVASDAKNTARHVESADLPDMIYGGDLAGRGDV